MDEFESLSHFEVGVQVPRCIYTEVPPEGVVRQSSEAFGRGVPEACRAEGVQDRRRASAGGPCSHDDLDTTEICSVAGCGIHEGQERDSPCASIRRKEAELRRAKLLGARILCFYRRPE